MNGKELYIKSEKLALLSGMAYAQGKYTIDEWIGKVDIDPSQFKEITIRNGLCFWTRDAEKLVQSYFVQVNNNWLSLGV